MTQTISALYDSRETADAVVAELKNSRFDDYQIKTVAPSEAPDAEILASIRQAGVAATHAHAYLDGIRRGEFLVIVQPLFGHAARATAILQKHGAIDTGLGPQEYQPAGDAAAPFSSAFGWRMLIENPAPLSSLLNLSVLSAREPPKPLANVVDNPAPFSKAIGMAVLAERPTPFSSRFGWRVLWKNPSPLSKRFNWTVLSKDQKPPPARFGLPLLSHHPAPLSARLGLKLLSNDPAPFSRLLGWSVLSGTPKR